MTTMFSLPGHWYRGNLHMHSTESDGKLSVADAIAWYRERGYDFISLTDHRITIDTTEYNEPGFLVIPGTELDCVDPERNMGYHVVGIDHDPITQEAATRKGPGQQIVDIITGHGGLAIMAHPYWLGQDSVDITAVTGAFGIEVYNTGCADNCKEYAMAHWDGVLDRGQRLWGLATDDAHHYEGDAGGGWIMLKAPELTRSAIRNALMQGHFYSTQGPTLLDLHQSDGQVRVHVSPVKEIRFIGNRGRGRSVRAKQGEWLTTASCPTYHNGYLRVECVDEYGRMVWSQPIFFD